MIIIEAQSGHLTNYEVFRHVDLMQARYGIAAKDGRSAAMKSGNLETVMKELMDYLSTPPSPLARPTRYKPDVIRELFKALQPYSLTKAELLMILDLRPQSEAVLHSIVEEFDDRFDESACDRILQAVGNLLGNDNVEDTGQEPSETPDQSTEAIATGTANGS